MKTQKLGQKIHKSLYCALYQFSTKAFFIQKKMFLIEITIQVSFTSCCTAKKEKGSSSFFSEDFFFLQLNFLMSIFHWVFLQDFCFFLLACFLCFLGFCSLVVVFFFGTSGSKTKTLFLFLLLVLFSFGYFFFFLVSCSLLVKKNCGVWQIFIFCC